MIVLCCVVLSEMKVIAAYLLAVLGGNANPSADDLQNILGSGILSLSVQPGSLIFNIFQKDYSFLI